VGATWPIKGGGRLGGKSCPRREGGGDWGGGVRDARSDRRQVGFDLRDVFQNI